MGTKASPHWVNLLNDNQYEVSGRQKKKAYVSPEQRVELLNFVMENPELVTHSSTKENEQDLWSNLSEKLNAMLPEKSVFFWKNFFKRWVSSINAKNESSLTIIDYKLKNFLKKINDNKENTDEEQKQKLPTRRNLSIEDIHNNLKEIEAEKTKLKIDIDSMQYSIVKYKILITQLKKNITQKKRKCEQLSTKKTILNNKRRKIEEDKNLDKDCLYT